MLDGVVFSGDIAQAFDSCPVLSVCEALYAAGAHPKTIALFLWEQLELSLHPAFAGLDIEKVNFEGILKQGGKDGPFSWSIFLAWIMDMVATCWAAPQCKYGIDIGVCRITHITWSDNVFLFAKDSTELGLMLADLTRIFAKHNLKWKDGEMFFVKGGFPMTESECDQLSFPLSAPNADKPILVKCVPSFKALGCKVDSTGHSEINVEFQLSKARGTLYAEKAALCAQDVSLAKRFAHYVKHVVPVALFSCTTWVLTQSLKQRLDSFENACLRFIVRVARKRNKRTKVLEGFVQWRHRHTAACRKLFHVKHKYSTLFNTFVTRLFNYTLKLSQQSATIATILIRDTLAWRNSSWWETMKSVARGDRKEAWRHSYTGSRPRNWEDIFVYAISDTWMVALSKVEPLQRLDCVDNFLQKAHIYVKSAYKVPKRKPIVINLNDDKHEPE